MENGKLRMENLMLCKCFYIFHSQFSIINFQFKQYASKFSNNPLRPGI